MSSRKTTSEETALIAAFLQRKLDRHGDRGDSLHPKFTARRRPAAVPPPAPAKPRLQIPRSCRKWQTVDWYELPLYAFGRVHVPDGCLVTGGDRAWRREVSP